MIRPAILACAATATLLPVPAHATPWTVDAMFVATAHEEVGTGAVAAALCRTIAATSTPVVVERTSVTCSANDATEYREDLGPVSATWVANATSSPVTFCVSGSATLRNVVTQESFVVNATPRCVTFG